MLCIVITFCFPSCMAWCNTYINHNYSRHCTLFFRTRFFEQNSRIQLFSVPFLRVNYSECVLIFHLSLVMKSLCACIVQWCGQNARVVLTGAICIVVPATRVYPYMHEYSIFYLMVYRKSFTINLPWSDRQAAIWNVYILPCCHPPYYSYTVFLEPSPSIITKWFNAREISALP